MVNMLCSVVYMYLSFIWPVSLVESFGSQKTDKQGHYRGQMAWSIAALYSVCKRVTKRSLNLNNGKSLTLTVMDSFFLLTVNPLYHVEWFPVDVCDKSQCD